MRPKSICLQLFTIITVLFTQLNTIYVQSVDARYQINGQVADSASHKPISLATVRIRSMNDELINVSVTKADGSFRFSGLEPVSYKITITVAGYSPKLKIADLSRSKGTVFDLGKVRLESQATLLNEVSIKGEKPVIRRKADRITYDLKADPESKGNNVLTMMRKVPYLSLDGDDNLLLKGNSSFKVMINGKPSGSLENNLKAVLKSMPAATIERIEVITNPPSKYDAEGLAGIINIVTSKRVSDGYNGTINVNESGPTGGPGLGAAFTAKAGKFGVSANGGGNINYNPTTYNLSSRQSLGTVPTTLLQQGNQRSNNKTAYLSTGLSYQIDSLNLLTAQLNYNGSRVRDQSGQSSDLNGPTGLLERYNLRNDSRATGYGIDAGINYEMAFRAKKNQLLTFSYLFSTNLNDRTGTTSFSNRDKFATPDFQQNDHQKFKEHTFQVDFNTPVKRVNIEAGLKGILRSNSSDFQYKSFDTVNNQFELDPTLSNGYINTQNVFSAYNSYQINLNSWNINAGARIEQTVIRAGFLNTATVADQNYFNVVPSVSASKQFKMEAV